MSFPQNVLAYILCMGGMGVIVVRALLHVVGHGVLKRYIHLTFLYQVID